MKQNIFLLILIGQFFGSTLFAQLNVTAIVASNYNNSDVSCFGAADGEAIAVPSMGTGPYTYLWDAAAANQTSQTATGLADGSYTVTVTDVTMATATSTVVIINPPLLIPSVNFQTNVSCNGGSDGTASVSISGGTGAISFLWPSGPTTSSVTGLSSGTHSVSVTDINGCLATTNVVITQPSAITATISSQTNVACNGTSDGSLSILAMGGTAPYLFIWSSGQTITQNTLTNLAAGSYCVTVMDANACTAQVCETIIEPSAIAISFSNQNVSCNGGFDGEITAFVVGGTPVYTYTWSTGLHLTVVTGITAGNYSLTVTDMNGCTASAVATVTEPSAITLSTTATQMSCALNDAVLEVNAAGGVGNYTYFWTGGATAAIYSGVPAGSYDVTVTDQNGCVATAGPEVINAINLTYSNATYLVAPDSILNFCVQLPTAASSDYIVRNPILGNLINNGLGCNNYVPAFPTQNWDTVIVRTCNATDAIETMVEIFTAGCVWAGDTDTNQLVNNFDLLPIGQHYGLAGNTRPNAGTDWDCEPMIDWTPVSGQPNPKHSDTNGDGFIDDNDTLAIMLNWGQLYLRSAHSPQMGGVPIYVDTAQSNPGDTLYLPIMLGNASQPAALVYGIAFTIQYDNSIVDTNSIGINFNTSWLGTKGIDMITIYKDFYNLGEVEIGMVRIDHTTRSNAGAIGHIAFTIKDDVLKRNNRRLNFSIKDIKFIDSLGNTMPISPEPSSVLIVPSGLTQTAAASEIDFQLFPNPTAGLLQLRLPAAAEQKLQLFDALGSLLQTHIADGESDLQLDVQSLAPGTYFLSLKTEAGVIAKRFVKY